MDNSILKYQQKSHANYLVNINQQLNLFPDHYIYPTGNPIRPLPPVKTALDKIMIIGAYPSARFESYKSANNNKHRLIPIADNLQPFADEEYFDGIKVRHLESGKGLYEYLLKDLNKHLNDYWITDLVKVFLYKDTHRDAINDVFPEFQVPVLRSKFRKIGEISLPWIQEEIDLCNPSLIITLGEEVAQIVSGQNKPADELLSLDIYNPESLNKTNTIYAPHPDACRRSEKWKKVLSDQIKLIRNFA